LPALTPTDETPATRPAALITGPPESPGQVKMLAFSKNSVAPARGSS
jgi:hypothetical protein